LAEAEFGKKWPNFGFAEAKIRCNPIFIMVILDFGSSSSKSGLRLFFVSPAKSGSSQISSLICWMLVQLHHIRLITDKLIQLTHQVVYSQFLLVLPGQKNIKSIAVPGKSLWSWKVVKVEI